MKVILRRQTNISDRRFLMELEAPAAAFKEARPGQFLHVRVEASCDPLLRRPLSIHDIVPGRKKGEVSIKVLYEVVGKGTELLSGKTEGSVFDVLGPLGNGFDAAKIAAAEHVVLVAGGMGVAPLYYLARVLSEGRKIVVLIGAKTKAHLVGEKMFRDLGCDVRVATDDGSKGHKGFVTELLKEALPGTICACGPKVMLAAVSAIAEEAKVPSFVSLEEFMGCGLGACLGCVIRTTSGYQRICHDGPVFDGAEVIWKR